MILISILSIKEKFLLLKKTFYYSLHKIQDFLSNIVKQFYQ